MLTLQEIYALPVKVVDGFTTIIKTEQDVAAAKAEIKNKSRRGNKGEGMGQSSRRGRRVN